MSAAHHGRWAPMESRGDVRGIIGKKVGMTQVYAEDGRAIPVTVIEAGPCVVVQRKSKQKDGYEAVQLGLVERPQGQAGHQGDGGPLQEGRRCRPAACCASSAWTTGTS